MSQIFQDDFTLVRACPDCGQHNRLLSAVRDTVIECARCGKILRRIHDHSVEKILGFSLAGIFFYLALLSGPLLDISLWGRPRSSTLMSGPSAFNQEQYWLLGAVVLLTTIAMPLIKLVLMLVITIGLRLPKPSRYLPDFFRWYKEVSKWAMPEIYLLGLLVAYTRLQKLVFIQIDDAVYALAGVIFAFISLEAVLDEESLWQEMERKGLTDPRPKNNMFPVLGCTVCNKLSRTVAGASCSYCGATLHRRHPRSFINTLAFIGGAVILYIPANALPVMIITQLGKETGYTIAGGMMEFVQAGIWPLAVLIFMASIAIPLLKLLALGMMLLQTHLHSGRYLLFRTRLYRFVAFIGRWSMVDIFMLSLLVALMRYGQMSEIRPGLGAPCFAAVVVLTMLAVESFDPRLMWDAAKNSAAQPTALQGAVPA